MTADVMQGWGDFLVAEAGAAAALSGLLFVAVSINLTRILEFEHLPARAAEALVAIASVLVVATFALVPQQSPQAYGMEIGLTGFAVALIQAVSLVRTRKLDRRYVGFVERFLINQAPAIPFIISGGLLLAGRSEGVYWIVPGTLLSFGAGIFGAWILLVEIQR